jgi:glyoxylase-like metal-dependent hydrolase (beta-lactamase superfamily II)
MTSLLTPGYETEAVAEDALAFVSTEFRSVVVTGNSVAIAGDESVLVVDSGHFPSLTRRQIGEVQHVLKKPVKYLVNTHWHPDHWIGNGTYASEYPDMLLLSHPFTSAMMRQKYPDYPRQMNEQLGIAIGDLKGALRSGKRRDGSVMSEEDKRYRREVSLPDLEEFTGEVGQMIIRFPNATFENRLNLDLGGRTVELMHLGRGNTAGDVVIHVPGSRLLMTGDLVVAPTPFSFGSYLREWVQTLARLRDTGAETIIPGHGPVMHDWSYVDTLSEMLQSVSQQVREEMAKASEGGGPGPSVADVQSKVDLNAYQKRLAGDSYILNFSFEKAFIQPAVERAFLEEKFAVE